VALTVPIPADLMAGSASANLAHVLYPPFVDCAHDLVEQVRLCGVDGSDL